MTIIVLNIPDIVYLSIPKPSMELVMSFLEQHSSIDKFTQLLPLIPPYPAFAWFNKSHSQETQWSGKVMKAVVRMIVSVVMATLLNSSACLRILFNEALLWVKHLLYLHLMEQYW